MAPSADFPSGTQTNGEIVNGLMRFQEFYSLTASNAAAFSNNLLSPLPKISPLVPESGDFSSSISFIFNITVGAFPGYAELSESASSNPVFSLLNFKVHM